MVKMIFRRISKRFYIKLAIELQKVSNHVSQATLPKFGNNPQNIIIELPRKIFNPQKIFLGNNVFFGPGSFLNPMTEYPTKWMRDTSEKQEIQKFDPNILIGNNVTATSGLQVTAYDKVIIEDDVMFATNIHINDGSHGYENADIPFKYQKIFKISPITIKEGSWIGQNVVILSGVTIGDTCIIGANSVVTKNIPNKSIAVGNPAKVIKSLDDSP